jgi:hypothetical protein
VTDVGMFEQLRNWKARQVQGSSMAAAPVNPVSGSLKDAVLRSANMWRERSTPERLRCDIEWCDRIAQPESFYCATCASNIASWTLERPCQ